MGINREIRYETAGSSSGVSQVFYNNYLADSRPVQTPFFSFEKPMFYTYGGTLNYYGQDPYAIFTNLVRPPIRFIFSANTGSLSGDTYFIHEIYRLDYETYKLYSDNQIDSSLNINNKLESNTKGTTDTPAPSNAPSKEYFNNNRTIKGNNPITQPEKFFGQPLTINDQNTIQDFFKTPLIVFTASTSAITGNIYDLYIDQFIKQFGKLKSDLFLDKSQYFINTKLVSNFNLNKNYVDYFSLNSENRRFSNLIWSNNITVEATNSVPHTISIGPFSGITLSGNYFTYFIVPDKPALEYPIMSGQLSTFTPEFRWSNGDKADSFIVQISYELSNTGFTGNSVFNYPVDKTEKNTKISRSKTKGPDSEFESEKSIFTFQIPVKSNNGFIYRVGNSKELIDIFNIRRNVITFTDYYSATTQVEPIRVYVRTESDSPFEAGISGYEFPPSLDYESIVDSYTLSGMVSGSTVTGATIQLTYPNSSFTIGTTDELGYYSFSGLGPGTYTLTTNYRGYIEDVRTINMTGDSSLNYEIQISWGDIYDQWIVKENEIIKY